jgi:hypothetical protein
MSNKRELEIEKVRRLRVSGFWKIGGTLFEKKEDSGQ